MAEIVLAGKRLQELKVTELKKELDKRGLQKKGVKSLLIDRLRKAILLEELTQVGGESGDDEEEEEDDEEVEIENVSLSNISQSEAPQTSQIEEPPLVSSPPPVEGPPAGKDAGGGGAESDGLKGRGGVEGGVDSGSDGGVVEFSALLSPKGVPRRRRWRRKGEKKETPAVVAPPTAKAEQIEEVAMEVQGEAPKPEPVDKPREATPHEPGDDDLVLKLSSQELRSPGSRDGLAALDQDGLEDDLELVPMDEDLEVDDKDETPPLPDERMDNVLDVDRCSSVSSGDLEEDVKDISDEIKKEKVEPEAAEQKEDGVVAKEAEPVENISLELSVNDSEAGKDPLAGAGSELTAALKLRQKPVHSGGRSKGRLERLESVQIEPIYQPDDEELLYEGDLENEAEAKTKDPSVAAVDKKDDDLDAGKELGFVVDIHGTLMDDFSKEQDTTKPLGARAKPMTSTPLAGSATKAPPARKVSGETQRKQAPDGSIGNLESPASRTANCHLWVSGLVATVRALDLQTLFSPFGQVVSAKVMAKAHSRNQRYGYVTMATTEQGQRCIKELNGTELKGRKISVNLSKTRPTISRTLEPKSDPPARRTSSASPRAPPGEKSVAVEKKEEATAGKGQVGEKGGDSKSRRGGTSSDGQTRDSPKKSSQSRRSRSRSRERRSVRRVSRSPPGRKGPLGGRVQRGRRRSRSPLLLAPAVVRGPGDARHDIMRREAERRDLMERRLGGDPYLRERERQVEMRLEERRMVHDRHQEMILRRQLEMEHSRREQEAARRMQEVREREAREREARERQFAEQERLFKERERELREREYRERQRREMLERALREREAREREIREREKKMKDQYDREIREREARAQRERDMRERELKAQVEKERVLRERERERHFREEQERIQAQRMVQEQRRMHEEHQRRVREEQQRRTAAAKEAEEHQRRVREEQQRRAAAAKEAEEHQRKDRERRIREKEERERVEMERLERERAERDKAERERQERERRERERQDRERRERERREEERTKREREEREREQKREREIKREEVHVQSQRLGKRPYSGEALGFEGSVPKRPTSHESPRSSDVSGFGSPSSVFVRLAPPTQKHSPHSPEVTTLQEALGYRRAEPQVYERPGRVGTGGGGTYHRAGGASQISPSSRERHLETVAYPATVVTGGSRGLQMGHSSTGGYFGKAAGMYEKPGANVYGKPTSNVYGKAMSGIVGSGGMLQEVLKQRGGLPMVTPEVLTAATQVLQNFQKTVVGSGSALVGGSRVSPQVRIGPPVSMMQLQGMSMAGAAGGRSLSSGASGPPSYFSMSSRMGGGGVPGMRHPMMQSPGGAGGGGGGMMMSKPPGGGHQKLPSEEDRYNRRISRPPSHQARPTTYKRLI